MDLLVRELRTWDRLEAEAGDTEEGQGTPMDQPKEEVQEALEQVRQTGWQHHWQEHRTGYQHR